jgi:hypothetical protein
MQSAASEPTITSSPVVPVKVHEPAPCGLSHGSQSYVITVTADAFSQIAEARKDDNFASFNVAVRDNHVEPT